MKENQKLKKQIDTQQISIQNLKKQQQEGEKVRADFFTLKFTHDQLIDAYEQLEQRNEEMDVKYQALERSFKFMETERQYKNQKVADLTNALVKRN